MVSGLWRGEEEVCVAAAAEENDIIGKFLFANSHVEETKVTIWKFWTVREKNAKEKENNRPRQGRHQGVPL